MVVKVKAQRLPAISTSQKICYLVHETSSRESTELIHRAFTGLGRVHGIHGIGQVMTKITTGSPITQTRQHFKSGQVMGQSHTLWRAVT